MPETYEWWLRPAYCDICKVEIRRHHMARHRQSAMHKRLAGDAEPDPDYEMMPSDYEFAAFLETFRAVGFRGFEARLYAIHRTQSLGFDRYDQRQGERP